MDGILSVENFDTSLAEGLMLLTPFSADEAGSQDFVKAYEAAYGEVPLQFGAGAYDAVYAIKEAAEKAGITPDMSVSDICDAMKTAMTEIDPALRIDVVVLVIRYYNQHVTRSFL